MDKIPEISIYGDSAEWLVCEGIKLFTLRLDRPKYANLQIRKNILTRYDHGFNLGVVYSRGVKPLKDYTTAELLLDGYMSTIEAAKDLRNYPGYEGVTLDTPMLGIGVTSDAHFHSYLDEEKRQLLFSTPLDQAVRMPEFHDFFLPSYLWWAILKNEQSKTKLTVTKWHNLLCKHLNFFDSESLQQVRKVDEQTEKFYKGLSHKKIREILKYGSTASPEYKSLVLCRPISVKK